VTLPTSLAAARSRPHLRGDLRSVPFRQVPAMRCEQSSRGTPLLDLISRTGSPRSGAASENLQSDRNVDGCLSALSLAPTVGTARPSGASKVRIFPGIHGPGEVRAGPEAGPRPTPVMWAALHQPAARPFAASAAIVPTFWGRPFRRCRQACPCRRARCRWLPAGPAERRRRRRAGAPPAGSSRRSTRGDGGGRRSSADQALLHAPDGHLAPLSRS
jgi:hypothetical protein